MDRCTDRWVKKKGRKDRRKKKGQMFGKKYGRMEGKVNRREPESSERQKGVMGKEEREEVNFYPRENFCLIT